MKSITHYVLSTLITISVFTATAQTVKKQSTLEISGVALLNDARIRNYAVSVYLEGTKVDSLFSTTKKPVYFTIDYNRVYTLLFQKEGCLDKMVILNTYIPDGLKDMKDETFDFEIEMSQRLTKESVEIEDYPVAVLLINEKTETLEESKAYYKLTHKETTLSSSISADRSGKKNMAD